MLGQPGKLTCPSGMPLFLPTRTIVAVEDGRIIGFGDMDGHRLSGSPVCPQRLPRAGNRLRNLRCSGNRPPRLSISPPIASITARPFFERRGWRIVREQQVDTPRGASHKFCHGAIPRGYAPRWKPNGCFCERLQRMTGRLCFPSTATMRPTGFFSPGSQSEHTTRQMPFGRTQYADVYQQRSAYKYAVCLKNSASPRSSAPVGYVHLDLGDAFDLGYGLRTPNSGTRGIASEAAAAERISARPGKTVSPTSPLPMTGTIPAAARL